VLTKLKSALSSMFDTTVILNFDLLIPKPEVFILVPKSANADTVVKICPIVFKILCQRVGCMTDTDSQTDSRTAKPRMLSSGHYVGRGIVTNTSVENFLKLFPTGI